MREEKRKEKQSARSSFSLSGGHRCESRYETNGGTFSYSVLGFFIMLVLNVHHLRLVILFPRVLSSLTHLISSLSVHWCSEERNALRNDWNMASSLPLKLSASVVVNGPLSWNKRVSKSVWAWNLQQWLFLPSQRSESMFEVLRKNPGD